MGTECSRETLSLRKLTMLWPRDERQAVEWDGDEMSLVWPGGSNGRTLTVRALPSSQDHGEGERVGLWSRRGTLGRQGVERGRQIWQLGGM